MPRLRNARLLGVCFALSVLFATPAVAADTVKIIVPFAAGGPVDMVARLLAQELGPRLNADVVVENRGGAGGALAAEMVVRAPPDGKTLYVASHGSFVINAGAAAASRLRSTQGVHGDRPGGSGAVAVHRPQGPSGRDAHRPDRAWRRRTRR